jgi:hypothetical protein
MFRVKKMSRYASNKRRHSFYRALQVRNASRQACRPTVHVQTVRNRLKAFGLGHFRAYISLRLTPVDHAACLE